ncbi:MAG: hypothetical protein ACOC44_19990, partial [Promethearchaeia archaeon]
MSEKGRKKREPIFQDINPENEKEKAKTVRFYESEKDRIENKLEERGIDFSSWVRRKGRELVNDQNLKEKIKRLEKERDRIKQTRDKQLEEIESKIEKFKDQLEDRQKNIEEIREEIKEYLREEIQTGKTPEGEVVKKELDDISKKFDILFKNRQEVKKIYFVEKSKLYKGEIKE